VLLWRMLLYRMLLSVSLSVTDPLFAKSEHHSLNNHNIAEYCDAHLLASRTNLY